MNLSREQLNRFWRDWSAGCRTQGWTSENGWTPAEIDAKRKELIERAGFHSLTMVDRVGGFTRVLKELAALQDDLAGMLRADQNVRRTALWIIRQRYAPGYWREISLDRFGTEDLEALSDAQVIQLRNTLADRQVEHRPGTLRQRRVKSAQHKSETAQRVVFDVDPPLHSVGVVDAPRALTVECPF